MPISKADIEHLKELAKVEFGKEDAEKLAKDLAGILGYVAALNEVDVAGVKEMTHAFNVKSVTRSDKDENFPRLDGREKILEGFPEREQGGDEHEGEYLKVKAPIKY